jgi:23S rRNA A2030 N6-methylase RlmJ
MIVRHPPYTLAGEMRAILPDLVSLLERKPGSGQWRIDMVTQE